MIPRRPRRHRWMPAWGGAAGGGGFFVQGTFRPVHGHHPSLLFMAIGVAIAVAAVLVAWLASATMPRLRRALLAHRRQRQRLRALATAEARARAMMSELCPHGWRAQITLFGPGDELPPDAPTGERARVALDWAELEDEHRRVAVVRRVWAASIGEALEAMVADRRTDETLEQIEQGAVWPDMP